MEVEDDKMPCNNHNAQFDKKANDYTTIETNSGDITFCISSYIEEAIKVIYFCCKHFISLVKFDNVLVESC